MGALACGAPPPEPPGPAHQDPTQEPLAPEVPTALDPLRLLVRASLDLRGVRPTLAEIAALEANPDDLDGMIEAFLDDPRFGRRVRETFDEVFLIRDEDAFVHVRELGLSWSATAMWEAIGEEPTRMLERIALEDRPYTELVTADWTMANEVLGDLFINDYPKGATGWRPVHYTDGRPKAGVLVSSGMWWQVGSMINNLNRGRANQISRTLLCADYLESEIDFTGVGVASSEEALGEAIRSDPACTSCHDTLDPLASTLYGFWFPSAEKNDFLRIRTYHPERERLWMDFGSLPPALHGEALVGLADLGQRIAQEDGYRRCFVRRSFEALLRRRPTPEEAPVILEALERFVDSGLVIREVWRSIVASDAYRAGTGQLAPKVLTPALLSSVIEDLTGFHWSERGWDLVRAPVLGYAPLAGGIDGIARNTGIVEPTPTLAAVVAQLAAMGARTAAERDLQAPSQATLLTRVDGTERLDGAEGEAAARAQLVDLHLRILGEHVAPDDPQLQRELDLWGQLLDTGSRPEIAWSAVLTVLLRHPDLVSY